MPSALKSLERRQYQVFIDRVPEAVFAFHTNLANHARICPPDQTEEVLSGTEAQLGEGSRIVLRVTRKATAAALITHTVILEVAEWNPPHGYALRQVEGPFKAWINRRKLTPFQGGTLFADQMEYVTPSGPLGLLSIRPYVGVAMDKYYQYRQAEAKRLIERIGRIKGRDAV